MNVTDHPMNELLSRFSYNVTPKAPPNGVKAEEGAEAESLKNEDKSAMPI